MSIVNNILSLNGYPMNKAAKELKYIRSLSVDAFYDWQQRKAWGIVKFHYQHNEFYKKKVGNRLPDNWDDLPVITKKDLQGIPLHQLISNKVKLQECYVGSTSGSSGIPLHFAKDKFTHSMTWALIANRYSWHNISLNDKQARFYGIPKDAREFYAEKIKDVLMNRTRFTVFDLSEDKMSGFVKLFTANKFKYLYGYSSALVAFARYLLKQGILLKGICPTLQLCISTSEMISSSEISLLGKAFGVKHIREYGVSETCITGFEDGDGFFKLTSETLLNEVVNDNYQAINKGENGRLLSTSLYNLALPMIRYEVGDSMSIDKNLNDIHSTIKELTGRTNDTIILPSGKKAAGLTIYYVLKTVLDNTAGIKEFIVRQTAIDKFVFDVVADSVFTDNDKAIIQNKAIAYLEPGINITINQIQKIERSPSGKLKVFYSEI